MALRLGGAACAGWRRKATCSTAARSLPPLPSRRFQSKVSLAFTARTCFLLADAGVHGSRLTVDAGRATARPEARSRRPIGTSDPDALPRDRVVKLYRVLAPNQEKVLSAFEEESWPRVVDDPIPPTRPPSSSECGCRTLFAASTPTR